MARIPTGMLGKKMARQEKAEGVAGRVHQTVPSQLERADSDRDRRDVRKGNRHESVNSVRSPVQTIRLAGATTHRKDEALRQHLA